MNSIKVCEYSRSMPFYDDLILQDQASGERFQDQWSSGFFFLFTYPSFFQAYIGTNISALNTYLFVLDDSLTS